jgi:hypothetical protein
MPIYETPINGFKVIYDNRAYHCIWIAQEYGEIKQEDTWRKPKFLEVTIINEDGEIRTIRDEAWMFQFVPRVETR